MQQIHPNDQMQQRMQEMQERRDEAQTQMLIITALG